MRIELFLERMRELLEGSTFAGRTCLVGGVVRDLILGKRDFDDFDVCVEQRYGGLKLAKYLEHRTEVESCETFPRFGSARMRLDGINLDLVETRSERYIRGRRYPRTRFCSLANDVWRRDFTVNGLYLDIFTEELLDPSGMGRDDLERGLIRTLRDPDEVFAEDSLRLLRALRFAATLGFEIEEDTAAAMHRQVANLKRLSVRLWQIELDKWQSRGIWKNALKNLREYGFTDFAPARIRKDYFRDRPGS